MSLPVTEDTPPDMLAGSMDLSVVLPNGKTVKMSVQRGTPMMDLLVQATTAHCLSPGDFSLQAMGDKGVLPFKPNTPIGALDTFAVKIVEKKSQNRSRAPQVPQSFLNTFRLQVHLPRSQLFVLRVTPDITLSEIMAHICTEKNLNLEKYEFRNPGKLDEVLELDKTLGDYKLQELSLVSKGNRTVTGLMSSADMINVKSSKNRQNSVCDSSLSSGSFGSRSGSPVPGIALVAAPPQPPIRKKRRPAPKPPSFVDKEKKERNFNSVLISHSRESSDSSGYHEASVLSESPTHGGPVGSDSPPDTLPRRSKLPASQSFTNLTSIQPAPKGRLISSVSNTSLNSTGYSRKKRAPPPPRQEIQPGRDDRVKSSTLPASIAEEMRNGFSFMTQSFPSAKVEEDEDDVPEDEQSDNAKVQIPVEVTSRLVSETKENVGIESHAATDVDVRVPPKPKPRSAVHVPQLETAMGTLASSKFSATEPGAQSALTCASPNQRRNLGKLPEDDETSARETKSPSKTATKCPRSSRRSKGTSLCDNFISDNPAIGQSALFLGKSDVREEVEEISASENADQTDHDSINWQYQLPPPPTDFRDRNSPNCTEFGTITITPELLENMDSYRNKYASHKSEQIDRSINFKSPQLISAAAQQPQRPTEADCNHHSQQTIHQKEEQTHEWTQKLPESRQHRYETDKKVSHHKSDVMGELTNILDSNRKQKEKSLSVSNLYINDPVLDRKTNGLNYSRSFSTEKVSTLNNYKFAGVNGNGYVSNRKAAFGYEEDDDDEDNEITYRNYKNLAKSSSMECIDGIKLNGGNAIFSNREKEEVFRKPVAPVQKKLKVARRSASTLGVNTALPKKRSTTDPGEELSDDSWADDPNISVLRQQFLEFLKEKKLMNEELKVNSLDVICNMLPEVVANHSGKRENVVGGEKTPLKISQGKNAQSESAGDVDRTKEDKVKVVDIKLKSSIAVNGAPSDLKPALIRHESIANGDVLKREGAVKSLQEKKQDLSKRHSYQGPPSINFATWGERPKTTRIIIKDEDYVTQAKLLEKKEQKPVLMAAPQPQVQAAQKPVEPSQKPKEVKKTQIVIKKPGVLSHYEMFSALPKRKEISSLKMVFMDEEEKRRLSLNESKDANRVPVVCGIELKKEFKEAEMPVRSTGFPPLPPTAPPPPPPKADDADDRDKKNSVSVYLNGNREDKSVASKCNFIIPKRNPALMPVVKGFRSIDDNETTNAHRISYVTSGSAVRGENPNEIHLRRSSTLKTMASVPPPPPPAPPVISAIKLKSISSITDKPKMAACQDPRSQLLDEIRNFAGLRKLNKAAVH